MYQFGGGNEFWKRVRGALMQKNFPQIAFTAYNCIYNVFIQENVLNKLTEREKCEETIAGLSLLGVIPGLFYYFKRIYVPGEVLNDTLVSLHMLYGPSRVLFGYENGMLCFCVRDSFL